MAMKRQHPMFTTPTPAKTRVELMDEVRQHLPSELIVIGNAKIAEAIRHGAAPASITLMLALVGGVPVDCAEAWVETVKDATLAAQPTNPMSERGIRA